MVFLSISAISLNGCSHVRVSKPRYLAWQDRYTKIQAVTYWQVSGVLSVTAQYHRSIVRFTWEQEPNKYNINLSGPLNFVSIYIEGSKREVKLWHTKKQYAKATTPELLLAKYLGWQLPVSNLRHWIFGIPAPTNVMTEPKFDHYGHLVTFVQDGWCIKYMGFQYVDNYRIDLPALMELKGGDGGIVIRIKVTKYSA